MLKKLVKYGNSNALVLDKAILELLNIEEGSIVKIKTDGSSIIITAHQVDTTKEKISPTATHNEIVKEASIKEMLKQYKHLNKDQKELYAKEFSDYQSKRENNLTDIKNKLQEITEEHPDTSSNEYQTKVNSLQNTLMAENKAMPQDMIELSTKHGLPIPTQKQMADMQTDFTEHFKKHAATQSKLAHILNNPEYIHELQLIAEKYGNQIDSTEYLKLTREVLWKYLPEMRQADEDMAAITKKYASLAQTQ